MNEDELIKILKERGPLTRREWIFWLLF